MTGRPPTRGVTADMGRFTGPASGITVGAGGVTDGRSDASGRRTTTVEL